MAPRVGSTWTVPNKKHSGRNHRSSGNNGDDSPRYGGAYTNGDNLDAIKLGRYCWGAAARELFGQRSEEIAPCPVCDRVRLKPAGQPCGRCQTSGRLW